LPLISKVTDPRFAFDVQAARDLYTSTRDLDPDLDSDSHSSHTLSSFIETWIDDADEPFEKSAENSPQSSIQPDRPDRQPADHDGSESEPHETFTDDWNRPEDGSDDGSDNFDHLQTQVNLLLQTQPSTLTPDEQRNLRDRERYGNRGDSVGSSNGSSGYASESPRPPGFEVTRSSPSSGLHDDALKLLSQQYLVDYSSIRFGSQREEIGRGTFGVVYKAKLDGTPVAVKELLPINDQIFKKEVGMLISFRHQNIVLLTGFCKAPNCFCIIYELFEKGSLHHLLEDKREKMDNDRCLKFALDIARGMNYLHKRNVLHLDLKPPNIMVDNGYVCKVTDFGLSKVAIKISETNSLHATNNGAGTPVYMAPEVFMSTNVGSKADIYSFGIIMWQLATREQPFSEYNHLFRGNPFALAVKVINDRLRPKLPSRAFYGYANLMERCWQHNPNDRPDFETIINVLEEMQRS